MNLTLFILNSITSTILLYKVNSPLLQPLNLISIHDFEVNIKPLSIDSIPTYSTNNLNKNTIVIFKDNELLGHSTPSKCCQEICSIQIMIQYNFNNETKAVSIFPTEICPEKNLSIQQYIIVKAEIIRNSITQNIKLKQKYITEEEKVLIQHQNKGFLAKYWYYIVPLVLMVLIGASSPEEETSSN